MMKIKNILYIVAVACFGLSCTKSPLVDLSDSAPVEDRIISFSIESSSNVNVSSRADGFRKDLLIDYGYVFFFDDEGILKGHYYVDKNVDEITNNGYPNPAFKINNPAYRNAYNLICVFNFDKTNFDSDFTDLTKDNVADKFPINKAFMDKVAASHNAVGLETRYDVPMPMAVNDFTDVNKSTHEIYRAFARMSIAIVDDLVIPHESHEHPVHIEDLKYTIVNEQMAGSVAFSSLAEPQAIISPASSIFNGTDEIEFPYSMALYEEDADHSQDAKHFMFEFPYAKKSVDGGALDLMTFDPHRLAILIAHDDEHTGETVYYKLNLVDKIENDYFNVERNHDYRIVIKGIYSRGYESLEEAYLMPPSNIEYEIFDEKGEMTYSNGQYAISMDEVLNYDEVQIYGHSSSLIEFKNICYIMPEQMDGIDLNDMTNSVEFEIVDVQDGEFTDDNWDGIDDDPFTVEVVQNDFETNPTLTDKGRSIVLKVTGMGSCTVKLKIKLGNLTVGREAIAIRKDADDGAFDAHPCQLKMDDIEIDPRTWQSADLDFGAWFDVDNNRSIVYIGDNAEPTGYQTMDGYVSSSSSKDAYPVFSEKSRSAFYSYRKIDASGNPVGDFLKTKIMLVQLPPAYLGHFGSLAPDGSTTHYNALIAERIEEIPRSNWEGTFETDGVMPWSNSNQTFYDPALIYSYDRGHYINLVEGLAITKYIVENNTSDSAFPTAADYCYYKNDINGNGVIEMDEPIVWYLPAQNQMLAMWINKHALQVDPRYDLNGNQGDEYVTYWTSTEIDGNNTIPSGTFPHVIISNIIEGETYNGDKAAWQQAHVRCVRGVKH